MPIGERWMTFERQLLRQEIAQLVKGKGTWVEIWIIKKENWGLCAITAVCFFSSRKGKNGSLNKK